MKRAALEFLACPDCTGELAITTAVTDAAEIMEGELHCQSCSVRFPIRGGIPRFVRSVTQIETQTAEAFGYEWKQYRELAPRYRQQFIDWLRPITPEFFRGKVVLEGGCGKGRHTALAAEFGARAIVAMDLGDAVESAYANTRALDNVHVVQADLNRPPVRRVFDYAFSIGVLHHLPDPETGFRALVSKLRDGGTISAWVYGREGNGWIVHVVSPIREHVTTRLPLRVLDWLSAGIAVPLFAATTLLYRPARNTRAARLLPYAPYLGYIADFPFREQRSIVFDHLLAPIAFYIRRDEFEQWFTRAGLRDVIIEHHNANSWRGCGRVPTGV